MNVSVLKPETIINEVFALYEKHEKNDHTIEHVLNLEHVSQAAALAEEEGFEDEVILAAFFHNIGYLFTMDKKTKSKFDPDNIDQERLGADFLRERGFSERVASLVESNVIAQRYLSYKYPEYYGHLSDADKLTLELHGGPMTIKEAAKFELNPDADVFLRLRYWDDKAKQVNKQLPDIRHIKLLMMSHLYKNN
jgi:2-amino-1-hydroxyethylphosphonate dioxygenase (glycine-forming)